MPCAKSCTPDACLAQGAKPFSLGRMNMLVPLRKTLLGALLVGSLGLSVWSVAQIAENPLLRPFVDRSADEIVAATDRLMAQDATPEKLATILNQRLAERPRNWVALQALAGLYAERGLPLPPPYLAAWDEDNSLWAQAGECASCAYDPAVCSLSNVLICQVPIALTPIADLSGVTRAGMAYAAGDPVDQIDLALSVVGLGATAAILASGGSSVLVKAGASTAKLARRMGRLSPRLTTLAADSMRVGVDWAALPAARSVDDLRLLVRADAFAPLTAIAADLERLRLATDLPHALHLLPLIDDAADARRLSNAAEALGPRVIARAEVLGKARLLRATVRVSNVTTALIAGFFGLAVWLASALAGLVQGALLRSLRSR